MRPRKKKFTKDEINDEFSSMDAFQKESATDNLKIVIKCKTPNQKKLVAELRTREIVVCTGPPGSGKTYLACAVALELLKKDPKYKKIYIVKSVTTLKDEEIGFLRGSLKEKMEPFLFSFMHNFEKIIGHDAVVHLRANNIIQEMPIAYMRGINIDNAITIIDEAQNINKDNIKTIMTRIGTDAKLIFLGDTKQIDMKNKKESSLQFILDNFSDIDEIGTVELTLDDVVRNPIVKIIEERFNKINEK